MTGPASRDDILTRVRAALAHDPALVETRRRAALDYLSAEHKTRVRGLRVI